MLNIFVCGDIVNYENGNGLICCKKLSEIINSSDYAVCNFEAPIAGYGKPKLKSGPHHAQRVETITGLKEQGFDLLLLANNHMLDYGKEGLIETIKEAKKNGMNVTGAGLEKASAYQPFVKKFNGLKIGIINAGEAQFGVIDHYDRNESYGYAWINHPCIDLNIIKLKRTCDFVIVFSHAGLEKYDIPQKEWRVRYKHLCDLGADVIIGSHPHVPQGYEEYGDSLIFYSLGNFYFDGGHWKDKENQSFSVQIYFEKGKQPKFNLIYHYTKDNKVHLAVDDKKVNVIELNNKLGKYYKQLHDEMVLDAFLCVRRNIAKYFSPIPCDITIKGTIKEWLLTISGRKIKKKNLLTAFHIMRKEAYYYVLRNALELEAARKNK